MKNFFSLLMIIPFLAMLSDVRAEIVADYKKELSSGRLKNIHITKNNRHKIKIVKNNFVKTPGALLFTNKGKNCGHIGVSICVPPDILEKIKGKPLRFSAKIKKIKGSGDFKVKMRAYNKKKLEVASPRAWVTSKLGEWVVLELKCTVPKNPGINLVDFQTGFLTTPEDTEFVLDEPRLEILNESKPASSAASGNKLYTSDMLWYAAKDHDKIDIVKDGQPLAAIIIDKNPTKCVAYAAKELNDHLEMCTGAKLPVITDDKDFTGPTIHLGKTKLSEKFYLTPENLPPARWIIRRVGNAVIISGGDRDGGANPINKRARPLGTLYGVYEFLERFLGVRWYWPGKLGTVAPECKNLSLADVDLSGTPSYEIRYFSYDQPEDKSVSAYQVRQWWLRMRRGGDGGVPTGNHSFEDWHKRFAKTHPEYFAIQKDGKPKTQHIPGGGHVCMSRPEVFKQKLGDVLQELQNADYARVMPGDSNALFYCNCRKCQAKINSEKPRSGRYSNAVWSFVNKVARGVYIRMPNKYITCCAYAGYRDVPDFRLMPNIVVTLCLIEEAPPLSIYMPDGKKRYAEIIESWKKTGARLFIWDYWDTSRKQKNYTFAAPTIFPRSIKEYFLLDCGIVKGHAIELPIHRSSDGAKVKKWTDWVYDALNVYVAMRLMWNIDTDVDKLLDEFYISFYGPEAGPWIKKFYTEMERAFANPNTKGGPDFQWAWESVWQKTYPPDFVRRVMGYLRKAVESTEGKEPYNARAKKTLEGFLPFEKASMKFSKETAPEPKLEIGISKASTAPIINGKEYDKCWKRAAETDPFKDNSKRLKPKVKTSAWITYDKRYLYLLIKAWYPKNQTLHICYPNNSRDKYLWQNESCEFFLVNKDKKYQFIISPNNAIFDAVEPVNAKQRPSLEKRLAWNCSGLKYASRTQGDNWTAELAIPLKSIDLETEKGGPWKINLMRNFYYKEKDVKNWLPNISCWSPNLGDFHDINRYGDLLIIPE